MLNQMDEMYGNRPRKREVPFYKEIGDEKRLGRAYETTTATTLNYHGLQISVVSEDGRFYLVDPADAERVLEKKQRLKMLNSMANPKKPKTTDSSGHEKCAYSLCQ